MKMVRGAVNIDALAALVPGAGLLALVMAFPFNEISVPLFGVPVTVLMMAAAGALVSFAYGNPEKSRKKLYILAGCNTFLASIFVAIIPRVLGWEWSVPKLEPALAGLVAWSARWAIPNIIKLVPEITRKIFRLDKTNDDKEQPTTGKHASKYDKYLEEEDNESNS